MYILSGKKMSAALALGLNQKVNGQTSTNTSCNAWKQNHNTYDFFLSSPCLEVPNKMKWKMFYHDGHVVNMDTNCWFEPIHLNLSARKKIFWDWDKKLVEYCCLMRWSPLHPPPSFASGKKTRRCGSNWCTFFREIDGGGVKGHRGRPAARLEQRVALAARGQWTNRSPLISPGKLSGNVLLMAEWESPSAFWANHAYKYWKKYNPPFFGTFRFF